MRDDKLRLLLLRVLSDLCQDLVQAQAEAGTAVSDLDCPRRVDDVERSGLDKTPRDTPGSESDPTQTADDAESHFDRRRRRR